MKATMKFNELAAQMQQNRARPQKTNIAIQVVSYHLDAEDQAEHYVKGINIETNKEIKVSLRADTRDLDLSKTPELKRYELADYADKSRDSSYVVSMENSNNKSFGVLVLTDCIKVDENTYTASWAHSAIHNSAQNKESLEVALCSVDIFPPSIDGTRHGRAQVRKALIRESQAFPMSDTDAMLSKIQSHMAQPEGSGYFIPEVIVRLIDNSNQDSYGPTTMTVVLKAPTKKAGLENEIPVYCTPEESMKVFLHPETQNPSHKDLQSIIDFCRDPEISSLDMNEMAIEIIPVERRNFGPETANSFFEKKTIMKDDKPVDIIGLSTAGLDLKDKFNMRTIESDESNESHIVNNRMFTKAIFVLNKHKDASVDYSFVSKVFTSTSWPKGYKEKHTPTPFFNELITQEDQYLCAIRTEEAAMSPEQLARHARKQQQKNTNHDTQSSKNIHDASEQPAQTKPIEPKPETKPETTKVVEKVAETQKVNVTKSKPEPEKANAPAKVEPAKNTLADDDFLDDIPDMDLAELDDIFNNINTMQR